MSYSEERIREIGQLNEAALNGDTDIVLELLEEGADVNWEAKRGFKYGWTPLMFAASEGHIDILDILLDYGADIDARDNDGYSALMHAIDRREIDAAEFLIKEGAYLHYEDFDCGHNVLTLCASSGDLHLFDLLIINGATDINHTDCYKMSPLMNAIWYEKYDIAERLIQLQCELDFQSDGYRHKGFTALMFACYLGNFKIVKKLVENGCDTTIKSEEGQTALDIAKEKGHVDIVKYLK